MTDKKNWAERWKQVNEEVKCHICEKRDKSFKMIYCAGNDADTGCIAGFKAHKMCIDPMRDWVAEIAANEKYICDDCIEDMCEICNSGDRTTEMLLCDNCDRAFHWNCISLEKKEFEKLVEEGSEGEWYCAECEEEYASDREWAKEHIVDDDDEEAYEEWSRAECGCGDTKDCVICSINYSVDTWKDFEPQNPIQSALKNAIDDKEHLVSIIMDNAKFINADKNKL